MPLMLRLNSHYMYLLRYAQVSGRSLSTCIDFASQEEKPSSWLPKINLVSDVKVPISSSLHALLSETQKLKMFLSTCVVSRSKALSTETVCTALTSVQKEDNGSSRRNLAECQNEMSTLMNSLPPESLDLIVEQYFKQKSFVAPHSNILYPGYNHQCLPATRTNAKYNLVEKAECDIDPLTADPFATACNGDFYDDNITSRTCFELDCVWSQEKCMSSFIDNELSHKMSRVLLMGNKDCMEGSNPLNKPLPSSNLPNGSPQRPNRDQLNALQDHFAETMPKFFVRSHDYRIYRKDILFYNNIAQKPYHVQGIFKYVIEVAKFRAYAYCKYANVRMHVLKTTADEDVGIVQVRWRISGIPQRKALMFWKFLPWKYRTLKDRESDWLDGFSTFHMDKDGLVYKHVMDNLVPDDERNVVDTKDNIRAKIARKIGLTPGLSSSASSSS